jgi:putative ferrous iron transport protein C
MMSLIAIKTHLMKIKLASLASLCAHFNNADPDLLRTMLCHWVRKGKVRCIKKTPFCGQKCMKCDVTAIEIYEWIYPGNV